MSGTVILLVEAAPLMPLITKNLPAAEVEAAGNLTWTAAVLVLQT